MRIHFKAIFLILISIVAITFSSQSYAYTDAEGADAAAAARASGKATAYATAKAAAEASQAAKATGFFNNIQIVADQLATKFNTNILGSLKAAGMGFAAKLITPALALAGTLSLLYLVYEVLIFLGSSDGSILNRLFDVGVPAVVAAMLITNYAANIDMFDQFLDLLRNVGGNPTGAVMNFYGSILALIGSAIKNAVSNVFSIKLLTSYGAAILDAALTCIFALVILAITLISMAEVIGLLLLGPFLYSVGIAFGPIMLAGIVTPWTREYAGKWVGFIVASAVVSGVLAVVISIAIKIFDALGFSTFVNGEATSPTLAMVAVILLAVNNLISQAPSIASAMVPGSLGASSGGGKGYTKAGSKNAVKGAKAGAKASPGVAWGGAKMGGRGVLKVASATKNLYSGAKAATK